MLRVALVSVDEFAFQPGVAGLRAREPCGLLRDLLRVLLRVLLHVLLRLVRARGAGNGGLEEFLLLHLEGSRVLSLFLFKPATFQDSSLSVSSLAASTMFTEALGLCWV